MDVLEKFLNSVSYKFPKGYPDMNDPDDVKLLTSILESYIPEADQSEEESSDEPTLSPKQQDLQKIIDIIDKVETEGGKSPSKLKLFDLLAQYTYKYYNTELGDIKKVFPEPISELKNWRDYVNKEERNKGEEIEQAIETYAQDQDVEAIPLRGKGKDVSIGGKEIEIKSSERNTITKILQTSYYKDDANKFYLFASNSKSLNLDIRIVSSQLLYRLNLGDDIADELSTNKQSQKLLDQINDGLATLDFPTMIQTSLATGESQETTKTFKIAKNVKIRFIISISS